MVAESETSLGANLYNAISRLEVSWLRLKTDLFELFFPAGPAGSHSHFHYQPPIDPVARTQLISAAIADYEGALFAIDVALELSAQYRHPRYANCLPNH